MISLKSLTHAICQFATIVHFYEMQVNLALVEFRMAFTDALSAQRHSRRREGSNQSESFAKRGLSEQFLSNGFGFRIRIGQHGFQSSL